MVKLEEINYDSYARRKPVILYYSWFVAKSTDTQKRGEISQKDVAKSKKKEKGGGGNNVKN